MRMCLGFMWMGLLLSSLSQEISAQNGLVILTELLPNPDAVNDAQGEWFEVYNPQPDSINLKGWVIRDAGTDYHQVTTDLWISPASYLVLGRDSDSTANGVVLVDYEYSGFILNNQSDEIILEDSSGQLIDSIHYTSSLAGVSQALSAKKLNIKSSDSIENWCFEVHIFGAGDRGSPGMENLSCLLDYGDLVITELMIDPVQVDDVDGEWFEIYNRSDYRQNLRNLQITDLDGDFYKVEEDLGVESQSYFLFVRNADTLLNGGAGTGHDYDGILLANTIDELILSFDTLLLDQVIYDRSLFPISQGRSMSLDEDYFQEDMNDHFGYWCRSSINYGMGDRGTPGNSNEPCQVLPVELLYFSSKPLSSGIMLSWETSYEENNAYFSISRSSDALDFQPVYRHETNEDHWNGRFYQFLDQNPGPGINYYRLEQTDLDGTCTTLHTLRTDYTINSNLIFPNPASQTFSVSGNQIIYEVSITDLQGRDHGQLDGPAYSVAHLDPGLYLVTMKTQNGILVEYLFIL